MLVPPLPSTIDLLFLERKYIKVFVFRLVCRSVDEERISFQFFGRFI